MPCDGTKVTQAVTVSSQYNAIIGGTVPFYFVSIPSSPDDCTDEDIFIKILLFKLLRNLIAVKRKQRKRQ